MTITIRELLKQHAIRTHEIERLNGPGGYPWDIPLEIDGKLVVPMTQPSFNRLVNEADDAGHPYERGSELFKWGYRGATVGNIIAYVSQFAEPIMLEDIVRAETQ